MMFVILSYDINEKRVGRIRKTVQKYLWQVHKSVYSGHLTESRLEKLKTELSRLVVPNEDSVCIYKLGNWTALHIEQLGETKETEYITL